MDMPWTQKLLNSLAKYLWPLHPLCRMHSLQFTYKIKKQCWPHMGPFFFFWKKNKQPLLKFSIKIHICIIIHFKAIREEWERSKENCRVSPLFVFLNRAEGSHWSFFSGWELQSATTTALDLVHLMFWVGQRGELLGKKNKWKETLQIPMFSYKQLWRNKKLLQIFFLLNTSISPFQKLFFFFLCNTLFI